MTYEKESVVVIMYFSLRECTFISTVGYKYFRI